MNNEERPPLFEKPDRRIMPLIVLVLIATVAYLVTPGDSSMLFYVELALYSLTILYGLAAGFMSMALRYSVMRPSVSKEKDAQMFWMEVCVGGFACAAFGAWLLVRLLV